MLLRKLSSGFLLPPLLAFGQKMPFLCKARSLSSSSEGPCTGADDGVRLVDSVSPLRCRHLSCRRVFALASLAFQTSHNTLHLNHLSSTGPSLSFLPPSSPSLSVPLHGSSLSNPIIYLLLPPGALCLPRPVCSSAYTHNSSRLSVVATSLQASFLITTRLYSFFPSTV